MLDFYKKTVNQTVIKKQVVNNTYLIMGDYQSVNNITLISNCENIPGLYSRNRDPNVHHTQIERSNGVYLNASGEYESIPIELQQMRREQEEIRRKEAIRLELIQRHHERLQLAARVQYEEAGQMFDWPGGVALDLT